MPRNEKFRRVDGGIGSLLLKLPFLLNQNNSLTFISDISSNGIFQNFSAFSKRNETNEKNFCSVIVVESPIHISDAIILSFSGLYFGFITAIYWTNAKETRADTKLWLAKL